MNTSLVILAGLAAFLAGGCVASLLDAIELRAMRRKMREAYTLVAMARDVVAVHVDRQAQTRQPAERHYDA